MGNVVSLGEILDEVEFPVDKVSFFFFLLRPGVGSSSKAKAKGSQVSGDPALLLHLQRGPRLKGEGSDLCEQGFCRLHESHQSSLGLD